jgi:hypothetical protein
MLWQHLVHRCNDDFSCGAPLQLVQKFVTILAARHFKSLFVVVYLVFNVNNISAVKHVIFGSTSRYNVMIFHVAHRYNVILQQTPHFPITQHQKSLRQ